MPADKATIQEYNKKSGKYLAMKDLGHDYLEKPAMYSLLKNIRAKKVLCLGCGAGEECAYIKSLGAKKVIGVDVAENLIKTARQKYPDIDFRVMDMERVKFPSSSFDLVYSSLALHYVKDWPKILERVKRVLKKDGFFLFSTHNPVYWGASREENKKRKTQILGYEKNKVRHRVKVWGDYLRERKIAGVFFEDFKISYYHKPFSVMLKHILGAGFKIIDCLEPGPLPSTKKVSPIFWQKASKIPLFIIFKLQK